MTIQKNRSRVQIYPAFITFKVINFGMTEKDINHRTSQRLRAGKLKKIFILEVKNETQAKSYLNLIIVVL